MRIIFLVGGFMFQGGEKLDPALHPQKEMDVRLNVCHQTRISSEKRIILYTGVDFECKL